MSSFPKGIGGEILWGSSLLCSLWWPSIQQLGWSTKLELCNRLRHSWQGASESFLWVLYRSLRRLQGLSHPEYQTSNTSSLEYCVWERYNQTVWVFENGNAKLCLSASVNWSGWLVELSSFRFFRRSFWLILFCLVTSICETARSFILPPPGGSEAGQYFTSHPINGSLVLDHTYWTVRGL